MERLTLEETRTRLIALAPEDVDLTAIDFDNFEATLVETIDTFPLALEEGIPPEQAAAALRILVAHQRHRDFEAGRLAEREEMLRSLRHLATTDPFFCGTEVGRLFTKAVDAVFEKAKR